MLRKLGLVFLVILAALAVALGFSFLQHRRASLYVEGSVEAIYRVWSFDELERRAARQLLEDRQFMAAGPEMFSMLSQVLGPLQSAEAPQGQAGYGWGDNSPAQGIHGNYSVRARFEKGDATVLLFVVKEDGEWRIAGFRVDSPEIAKALQRPSRS